VLPWSEPARCPGSVPIEDVWVDGPGGPVHALLRRPAGADGSPFTGPLPTIIDVHGGPTHHDADVFRAYPSAWVDHGYAVVEVNYRGSTGYGSAWRDALDARVGHIELQDVVAVRDRLVADGIADPDRTVLAGASWGGYLTLLGLGTYPDRWVVGLAGVPVADYLAAYEDEMEGLKAFDRALFGGSPEQVPDKYHDSSPLTYVDGVTAPVLILAGENDPRCPIRQIENYVAVLEQRGIPHEVYRYEAGHGSLVDDERVKQVRLELDFAARHLPPSPQPQPQPLAQPQPQPLPLA
jgi:dipeptidyl aminopeptidase/acylaminoacyl peptidase